MKVMRNLVNRKAAAIKARDEIIEKNNKIHNDILNRNWEEVFNSFLIESNRYNAIKTVKNSFFILPTKLLLVILLMI